MLCPYVFNSRKIFHYFRGVIGRGVVNDDHFVALVTLKNNAAERAGEKRGSVERRHNHGDSSSVLAHFLEIRVRQNLCTPAGMDLDKARCASKIIPYGEWVNPKSDGGF